MYYTNKYRTSLSPETEKKKSTCFVKNKNQSGLLNICSYVGNSIFGKKYIYLHK